MINIKSKYKIYKNLNTHCLFKSQMLRDCNEPNTSPCKKSLFLFHYPVQWFPTCIPWSPAEAFCILAISSTGSKISVTCSATHEKSWNTPKSLTASNLFFFRHPTDCFWYSCGNLHAIKKINIKIFEFL